jgi:cytochrome P450 PksS
MVAGFETTTNLIASGAVALIQHPEQRERLRQQPDQAESAIEELLRYSSPLEIASVRLAREPVTTGSVTIRPGELIGLVLGSANHDESQFPDPERLDITREPNRHVAFGQGPHFCLGAPLARLEGRIALNTLVQRFPNLRLTQPAESLRWRKSLLLRGLESVPAAT